MRNRRQSWVRAFALSVVIGLAMASGPVEAAGEVVVASWGGSLQEALRELLFKPFEEETGIKVIDDPTASLGKARAMVRTGNVQWDVFMAADRELPAAIQDGLLTPLDWDVISQEGLVPEAIHDYAAGAYSYATVFVYNTDLVTGEPPRGAKDFWNLEKYPGPRSVRNLPIDNLEFGLLAAGTPRDELYPIDVEKAFASLDEIKDSIVTFWDSGAHSIQLVMDGAAAIGTAWHGRVVAAIKEGAPLGYQWEDGILHWDFYTVLEGAPNRENAMKLIDYAMRPEVQAGIADWIGYSPGNRLAYDVIDPASHADMVTLEENYEKVIPVDLDWWGEHLDPAYEEYNLWLLF